MKTTPGYSEFTVAEKILLKMKAAMNIANDWAQASRANMEPTSCSSTVFDT